MIAGPQLTRSETQNTRPDSLTSSGMLACGPTKATDMLGTHTNDMRQRPTCLPRTFSRRASMALSMHTRACRARASHLASPQQHRIEHCDAPGCTPEHSGMPTHHSPLRRPSSRTAPTRMETMGEPPRRAAIGRRQGDDDRACRRQLGGLAAASLAEHIQDESWKQQRPFPLQKVAGNGVRWPPPTFYFAIIETASRSAKSDAIAKRPKSDAVYGFTR